MSDELSPTANTSRASRLLCFLPRWGGFLIVAALLAILFVGGAKVATHSDYKGNFDIWEHGWPFTFLRRMINRQDSHRFEFMRGENGRKFEPQKFSFDLGILVGVLGAIGWGPRLLMKRPAAARPGANFSLASLLVVMTLVCCVLGHLAWSLASSRAERAASQELTAAGHSLQFSYHGPVWLTRVFGTNQIPLPLEGVAILDLKSGTTDEDLRRQGKELQQLKRLSILVSSKTNISDDGLAFLAQQGTIARLEGLVLIQSAGVTPNCLVAVGQIKSLKHFEARYTSIRIEDCVSLQKRGVECSVIE